MKESDKAYTLRMFRVTSVTEPLPDASPAAVVRDGTDLVLVFSAGVLAPDVVAWLDQLLGVALSTVS